MNRRDVALTLYVVAFVALWTAYVLLGYRHVQALGEKTFAYAAAGISVRLLLWVLPVFVYLRAAERTRPLEYLKLTVGWRRGVVTGLAAAVLIFTLNVIRFGRPVWAADKVSWNSVLSTSLGVGFFEEIPFRGLLLQQLSVRMNFWLANLLTSLVFLGMHLSGWLMLHLFAPALAANVFLLSLFLGILFHYTRSLWSCIVAHSANDFISFLLFHGR